MERSAQAQAVCERILGPRLDVVAYLSRHRRALLLPISLNPSPADLLGLGESRVFSLLHHMVVCDPPPMNDIYYLLMTAAHVNAVTSVTADQANFPDEFLGVTPLHLTGFPEEPLGVTPLHLASRVANYAVVKMLLSFRADLTISDFRDNQPIHHAILGRNLPALDALLAWKPLEYHVGQLVSSTKNPYKPFPMALSAQTGDVQVARYLLRQGASLDESGENPPAIIIACRLRHYRLVAFLLEKGADASRSD
jgi:hypothetical protein